MKVDIRDLDNIWCDAIVKKIEKTSKNEEFIFIHYIVKYYSSFINMFIIKYTIN